VTVKLTSELRSPTDSPKHLGSVMMSRLRFFKTTRQRLLQVKTLTSHLSSHSTIWTRLVFSTDYIHSDSAPTSQWSIEQWQEKLNQTYFAFFFGNIKNILQNNAKTMVFLLSRNIHVIVVLLIQYKSCF